MCLGKFVTVDFAASESTRKEEKELEKIPTRVTFVVSSRADLRWVARSPLNEE